MFTIQQGFGSGDAGSFSVYYSRLYATDGTFSGHVPATTIDNRNYITVKNDGANSYISYSNGVASPPFFDGTYYSADEGVTYGILPLVGNLTGIQVVKRFTTTITKDGSYSLGSYTRGFTYLISSGVQSTQTNSGVYPYESTAAAQYVTSHNTANVSVTGGVVVGHYVIDVTGKGGNTRGRFDLFYEANQWGSTGPVVDPGDGSIGYDALTAVRQNNDIFKQNGPFAEYLYAIKTDATLVDQAVPPAITGGSGCVTFENSYANDNYITFDFSRLTASVFDTARAIPLGGGADIAPVQGYTVSCPFPQPMKYVDFTAGFNGFYSQTKQMSFYFTDYVTATVVDNSAMFSNAGSPDLSSGRETVVFPFTAEQTSWKLSTGAVYTETNSFLSFYTQSGRTMFPKVASAVIHTTTDQAPVVSGADGYSYTIDYDLSAKFSYRKDYYVPISFSQLYPQVFTYDKDITGYTMHDYSDMEPRWSKYKMHVIYGNKAFADNPAKVNLFYGQYSLYRCADGDKTLDRTVCATGVFTTQYNNSGENILIKYSPLIDIKRAHRLFWSFSPDYFVSSRYYDADLGVNGNVHFFNTWENGINDGQKSFVIPVKAHKWMPPENLLDASINDFTPLSTSNTRIYTNSQLRPLFYGHQYMYPIQVSRAYSSAEAYY